MLYCPRIRENSFLSCILHACFYVSFPDICYDVSDVQLNNSACDVAPMKVFLHKVNIGVDVSDKQIRFKSCW